MTSSESGTMSLDNSIKHILLYMIYFTTYNVSNLLWILLLWILLSLSLSCNLSSPTRVLPMAGLLHLLEHHICVLFEPTQSYIIQLEFIYIISLSVYAGIWTNNLVFRHMFGQNLSGIKTNVFGFQKLLRNIWNRDTFNGFQTPF